MSVPPQAAGGAQDPSMEDILASIRRILSEDEAPPAAPAAASAPPSVAADSGDVLALDSSMMVEEAASAHQPVSFSPPAQANPEPLPAPPTPPRKAVEHADMLRPPEPAPDRAGFNAPDVDLDFNPPPLAPIPVRVPDPRPVMPPPPLPPPVRAAESEGLIAPAAAAAAASSMGSLLRKLAAERSTPINRSGGLTIEDIVRDEMRPLLKEWLETHLPGMVERLVRAEIERVVTGSLG